MANNTIGPGGQVIVQQQLPTGKAGQLQGPKIDTGAVQAAALAKLAAAEGDLAGAQRLTTSSAAQSALAGGDVSGQSAAVGTFLGQKGMALESFGFTALRQEAGAAGTFEEFPLTNQKDARAANTAVGDSLAQLFDKQQASQAETVGHLVTTAANMSEALESNQSLKDAVALGKRDSGDIKDADGKDVGDAKGQRDGVTDLSSALNGAGGNVFGDLGAAVQQKGQQMGINFAAMPVEDAMMLMFMLISDDAQKDMRDQLSEMNATRLQRDAQRQAQNLLKQELVTLRQQAHDQYDKLSPEEKAKYKDVDDYVANCHLTMPAVEIDNTTGSARLVSKGSVDQPTQDTDVPPQTPPDQQTPPQNQTPPDQQTPPDKGPTRGPIKRPGHPIGHGPVKHPGHPPVKHPIGHGPVKHPVGKGGHVLVEARPNVSKLTKPNPGDPEALIKSKVEGENVRVSVNTHTAAVAHNVSVSAHNVAHNVSVNAKGVAANMRMTANQEAGDAPKGDSAAPKGDAAAAKGDTSSGQRDEAGEGQRQTGDDVATAGGYSTTFAGADTDMDTMKNNSDSLSELSEQQQLRMQMVMDRMTKADSMASNLLKKISDTANGIIANMK
jgi:hypothetical protein